MEDEIRALRRELRELRDHEEIRQLLYRYARGVDRADLELIQSVYAEGGTDQHGPFDGPGVEFAKVVVDGAKRVWDHVGNHHITNTFIELDGDRARAEVYFLAFHPHADNGRPELGIISGRYLDVLERRDGRWGIVRRVVVSDWTRNDFAGPEWERTTERAGYVGGRRGDNDQSYEFFA
ncbi:nuclear transport factor 2 family protein [Dactylosporangium sp. AC04546]|uniref:nuclear transport factor 2 family protein n=1 Tax=Dactylosporangium sp. AC04546 TaxID=2862460 RepID=UPI001EDD8A91|nr:nuclear transport factor 2 family protein [Dactylosporangium sp. AC04546]WVK87256.1 nuclear transport factor 2 family protein [Dactylosporangium sp. AC04546]